MQTRSVLAYCVCWGYLASVLCLWALLTLAGEHWWPATMLLFGPRWLAAAPLVILIPIAVVSNFRLFIPLSLGAVIVFGPFMGFCLNFGNNGTTSRPVLKVITCNIASGAFNTDSLSWLINESKADIVALQECPRQIRQKLKLSEEWNCIQEGALAVLSRFSLKHGTTYQSMHPPHTWPRVSLLECHVQTPAGEIAFYTLHLPSPRYGLLNILDRRTLISLSRKELLNSETLNRWKTAREIQKITTSQSLPVIVAGDFNMPVESPMYREVWGEYRDAFSKTGFGYGWSERAAVRRIPLAVRIDHVLTANGVIPRICKVGPDVGSDHLPLVAEVSY